jgi:GT2 family glycosyltransferase
MTTKLFCKISMVSYCSDRERLVDAINSITTAVSFLEKKINFSFDLVINDNLGLEHYKKLCASSVVNYCFGHGNVGFGRGHNLALLQYEADYVLIANPDIVVSEKSIEAAIDFLENHRDVGMLSPKVIDQYGNIQYLCKRYPSVALLFVRGFLPSFLRKIFVRYIRSFEFADEIDQHKSFEPIIATGCFMLVRGDIFRKIGGFDPRFFLYFEDYDLTMRIAEHAKVVYDPSIRIIHHGGGASRKGWWHIKLFITSAFRFFNKHGWRWY